LNPGVPEAEAGALPLRHAIFNSTQQIVLELDVFLTKNLANQLVHMHHKA
jgi:hypothetical protein